MISGQDVPCRICGGSTEFVGTKLGRYERREFHLRRCTKCRFAFIADPWTDYSRIYSEDYYAGRGADPLVDYVFELEHPDRTIREYEWRGLVRAVAALVPLGRHGRWLDYGCGNGGLVRYVRERQVCEAVGFEEGWIATQARRATIPIVEAGELDALKGTFDVVTAIEVLEHVEDPVAVMRQIRSLLKTGGLFFFTTGNAAPVRDILSWRYVVPEIHVSFFEPGTAALALSRAGFEAAYPGFVPGYEEIIRFKALKALGIKRRARWQNWLAWPVLARVIDARFQVSGHPVGWAR